MGTDHANNYDCDYWGLGRKKRLINFLERGNWAAGRRVAFGLGLGSLFWIVAQKLVSL